MQSVPIVPFVQVLCYSYGVVGFCHSVPFLRFALFARLRLPTIAVLAVFHIVPSRQVVIRVVAMQDFLVTHSNVVVPVLPVFLVESPSLNHTHPTVVLRVSHRM